MSERHHKHRVRVITDKVKYRRHQRKKLLRKLLQVTAWAVVLVVGVVISGNEGGHGFPAADRRGLGRMRVRPVELNRLCIETISAL